MGNRIVIAGGSGFLGRNLNRYFTELGYSVSILTRNPRTESELGWDASSIDDWAGAIDGAHALINLTGRTVDCRYNITNKAEILSSRVDSTRVLHQAVSLATHPPRFWLNSSTSTIYNDTRGDSPANTEAANNVGDDFSMGVAKSWEAEFFRVDHPSTVQTALRIAIVMGNDGGAFPVMSRIARFGLCSPQGPGDQWISWIHVKDFCAAVAFLLENPIAGCVNLCSPNPIQNREFNCQLKAKVRPWVTLPQPAWLLKLGAVFMRTETELILKSRKVAPERLEQAGFNFAFPTTEVMLEDLF